MNNELTNICDKMNEIKIKISGISITSKLLRITEGTKIFKILWYPYLFFYSAS